MEQQIRCEGAHGRPPNVQKKCADSNSKKDAFEAKHKRHERKSLILLLENSCLDFCANIHEKMTGIRTRMNKTWGNPNPGK